MATMKQSAVLQMPLLLLNMHSFIFICFISGCAAVCQLQHGPYQLRFARDQRFVHFQLTYFGYPLGINAWTGVAFGQTMRDGLDVVAVRVLDNRVLVSDEFVRGFRSPDFDARQDLSVQYASLINGNLRVRFMRPIQTGDAADFSLLGCLPWQFPTTLSPLGPDGHIHKHRTTPQGMIVCIDRCPCGPNSTPDQCNL